MQKVMMLCFHYSFGADLLPPKSLPQLRKENFYLNKRFYLNNKLLSRKISLEEPERTKSTVLHSVLCLQQPFRSDHHSSQFIKWEAERSAEFPTPL